MSRDIRWLQRFDNFSKACARLLTITDTMEYDALSELEKEGLIQRFEYTFELAWKVLQDYMQYLALLLEGEVKEYDNKKDNKRHDWSWFPSS